MPYFCATAALLSGAGLLTVRLGGRFAGANLWIFAIAPALPLYVVLNWDMLGVALTVGALLALRRDRDGLAILLLAATVWTKFFPLVILPLAMWDRLLRRRPRDAGRLVGVFILVSVAVSAPVALTHGPDGWAFRAGWLHFFRFNRDRPLELNGWNLLAHWEPTTAQINVASALLLAHVGGTRAYLLRAGALTQLTRDHSLVAAMVASGVLTEEGARGHPDSNKVLRSLGGQRELGDGYIDTLATAYPARELRLREGDQLLLCSDGVWGVLDDNDLREILASAASCAVAVEASLRRVLDGGAPDNATLIVARCLHVPTG